MSAYMIVIATLSDPAGFRDYAVEAAKMIADYGGEYIVRGPGESECLEGDWPDDEKVVVSRWPSMDAARRFWHSDDYERIKQLRLGKATVRVRLVDGVSDT